MSEKPWGGRFKESTSLAVEAYTESISFDSVLYAQDIAGSKAHARMLGEQGIISREEAETLRAGLDQVKKEIEDGVSARKVLIGGQIYLQVADGLYNMLGQKVN